MINKIKRPLFVGVTEQSRNGLKIQFQFSKVIFVHPVSDCSRIRLALLKFYVRIIGSSILQRTHHAMTVLWTETKFGSNKARTRCKINQVRLSPDLNWFILHISLVSALVEPWLKIGWFLHVSCPLRSARLRKKRHDAKPMAETGRVLVLRLF